MKWEVPETDPYAYSLANAWRKPILPAIIMTGIVILACIIAFAVISISFFLNAPW